MSKRIIQAEQFSPTKKQKTPPENNNFLDIPFSKFKNFIEKSDANIPISLRNTITKKSIKEIGYYDILYEGDLSTTLLQIPKLIIGGNSGTVTFYLNHSTKSFLKNFFSTYDKVKYRQKLICVFTIINRIDKNNYMDDLLRFYLVRSFIVDDLYDSYKNCYYMPSVDELFFFFGGVNLPDESNLNMLRCRGCDNDSITRMLKNNKYYRHIRRKENFDYDLTIETILKKMYPREYRVPHLGIELPFELDLELIKNKHNTQIKTWFSSFLFSFKKLTNIDIPLLCSEIILSYIVYDWKDVDKQKNIKFKLPEDDNILDDSIFKYTKSCSPRLMKCGRVGCRYFFHQHCCSFVESFCNHDCWYNYHHWGSE